MSINKIFEILLSNNSEMIIHNFASFEIIMIEMNDC